MTEGKDGSGTLKDAAAVERKFGELADVYAETRREAAEIAGDERRERHWKEVAEDIREDRDQ